MQSLMFGCPVIHLLGSNSSDDLGGARQGEEGNQHRTTRNHLKITSDNYGYLMQALVSIYDAEQISH